jgi:hypothetical protein
MHARIRAGLGAMAVLTALLASAPARATRLDLGLGAGYWFDQSALFDADLGLRANVAGPLSVGGRFGAMIASGPVQVGVPIDLLLHVSLGRGYLEGAAGPWLLFGESRPIRAHIGFGFGVRASAVSVGLEIGWLDPSPQLALRLAFAL